LESDDVDWERYRELIIRGIGFGTAESHDGRAAGLIISNQGIN
jgi:hypothetical protein